MACNFGDQIDKAEICAMDSLSQLPEKGQIHDLETAVEIFERGLYLQALANVEPLGPLASWEGSDAQIFGSRLANNLGAPKLATALQCRAYRADRENPTAAYFRAASIFNSKGPLRAWKFLRQLPASADMPAETRADILAIQARVLACFRDFESAEKVLDQAMEAAPRHAWVWCEKASVLRMRDEHKNAYEAVQQALDLRPFYRPAVQIGAELLQLLRKDDDAVSLLTDASERLESGAVLLQLGVLHGELENYDEAVHCWTRGAEMHPLAEPQVSTWLNGNLADACYRAGKLTQAAEYADLAGGEFYKRFAERLKQGNSEFRKIVLPVGFVAQHHMTCAPATLSAISAYWNVPVDHKELAAEICYEGTSDHVERDWAERKGFVAREFRLTWDIACALIDRGVPFTLTTVETTSAHLQALIGYDATRKTFILRDPSHRTKREVAADEFLDRYAPFGPRGMLLIPSEEIGRLDSLDLPDTGFYDRFYRLQRALVRHDREAAVSESHALDSEAPGHRLAVEADRCLAIYDENPSRQMEAVEKLLALYPKCSWFLWNKVNLLGRLSPGKEYRRFLHQVASARNIDPVFWYEWARELGKDARHARFASRYLLLALRIQPCEAGFLSALGTSLWNERRFEEATEIYRLAALVGGVDRWGWSYFLACRHTRHTEQALTMLRARYASVGEASAQPSRVLFSALSALDRSTEAFALLEETLSRRKTDGDFMLFAADEFARSGSMERAEKLLLDAQPHAAQGQWLRLKAKFADYRCDLAASLATWRMILEHEPLSIEALRTVARLTAETQGPDAAIDFLTAQEERFPHFLPLAELTIEFLRERPPAIAEEAIRRALKRDSRNAWLRRELGLNLANQRRFADAGREAEEAVHIDPHNPTSYSIKARVLELEGRYPASADAYREALSISIDQSYAIEGLFRVSKSFEEKKGIIDFIHSELVHQVVFGDGLLAFREEACTVLPPLELLNVVREALAARPDLWQAWVVTTEQLIDVGKLDEALDLAREASQQFPLVPRVWCQLSQVYRARGERQSEIDPLLQALVLSPSWGFASRLLSDVHSRMGDLEQARGVLEKAVAAAPLDAFNHGWLADVYWKLGRTVDAMGALRQAIRLNPDYTWAWDALKEWSIQQGSGNLALEAARELTQERGGEARSWLRLAMSLPDEDREEAIRAAEMALSLDAHSVDAHDRLAFLLCKAGRFPEALAASAPAIFGEHRPVALQGREAWIEAQRGNLEMAVQKMRAAVASAPDYYWGWNQLADWLTLQEKYKEAIEAAQSMARLAPRSAIPLGYIADIQLKNGDRRAGWETLRKAFHLDPSYRFAGACLFEEYLRTGDRKKAEEILRVMEVHHPGPETDAARVALLCRHGKKAEALDWLRKLCIVSETHTAALMEAGDAVVKAGWEGEARAIYRSLLKDPQVNPGVGKILGEILARRKYWLTDGGLSSTDARSAVGRAIRVALLDKAAETGRRGFVEKILRRDAEALRGDIRSWASGGYSLARLHRFREAADWMSDWRERNDAMPWMLNNLAISLRALKRDEEAHEVSLRAVTLRGDQTTLKHHLLLAWDEVMGGEIAAAESRLDKLPHSTESIPTCLRTLVSTMIKVSKASSSDRLAIYKRECSILRQDGWRSVWNDPCCHHVGNEGVRMMARLAGKRPYRLGGRLVMTWPRRLNTVRSRNFWIWIWVLFLLSTLAHSCSQVSP